MYLYISLTIQLNTSDWLDTLDLKVDFPFIFKASFYEYFRCLLEGLTCKQYLLNCRHVFSCNFYWKITTYLNAPSNQHLIQLTTWQKRGETISYELIFLSFSGPLCGYLLEMGSKPSPAQLHGLKQQTASSFSSVLCFRTDEKQPRGFTEEQQEGIHVKKDSTCLGCWISKKDNWHVFF